jgi:hypothetical protein
MSVSDPRVGHVGYSPDYKSSQETLFDGGELKPWQQPSVPLADPTTKTAGLVHEHSTDTERKAAALVAPRTGSIRERILRELYRAGEAGCTAWELAAEFGDRHYSVPPRLPELVKSGWVIDSQQRRATPSGADSIVWVLSGRGREELGGAK